MTTIAPLTAADRCDRCGARAVCRVQFTAGELMFCAHHEREYKPLLTEQTKTCPTAG